jgi:hypothetical protein
MDICDYVSDAGEQVCCCDPDGCAVDCVVSDWVTADPGCGVDITTRTRTVVTPGFGSPCPALSEAVMYASYACPSVSFALDADFSSLITDVDAYDAFVAETTLYLANLLGVSVDDLKSVSISPGSIVVDVQLADPMLTSSVQDAVMDGSFNLQSSQFGSLSADPTSVVVTIPTTTTTEPGPTTTTTTSSIVTQKPEPAQPGWYLGVAGESCDERCARVNGGVCNAESINMVNSASVIDYVSSTVKERCTRTGSSAVGPYLTIAKDTFCYFSTSPRSTDNVCSMYRSKANYFCCCRPSGCPTKFVPPPTTTTTTVPPVTARYVVVRAPTSGDAYLQIAQLVVKDIKGTNVAQGKTCSASTNQRAATDCKYALDGTAAVRNYPNVFHSAQANGDWWKVDLGASIVVKSVTYLLQPRRLLLVSNGWRQAATA